MTRKPNPNADDFKWYQDITVEAIRRTTIEERQAIAAEWSRGSRDNYKQFAISRHIEPAGLITAALIDAEHPYLVYEGRALFKSIMEAQIKIVEAEIKGDWIIELVHTPLVDSLWTKVVQVAVVHNPTT